MSKKINLLLVVFFIVFTFCFSFFYISNETQLYQCDYVDQNLNYYDIGRLFIEDINSFFHKMKYEIYSLNRNPFLTVFLLPFYFIFKESRFGFVFAIQLIFMFPVMLLILKIFNQYVKDKTNNSLLYNLMIYSSIFLFPLLWLPSLKGIPDICGMIPILFACILYFKYGLNEKIPTKVILFLSLLLYLSFLLRRWYSVVILAFFVSAFLDNFICSFNKFSFKNFVKTNLYLLLNVSIISFIGILAAFLIQGGYVRHIITNELNERALYIVNYNQLKVITLDHLGIIILFISILAIIKLIKNSVVRFFAINFMVYAFIFIIAMKNQFIWINHNLFLGVCAVILFISGLTVLYNYLKQPLLKNTLCILFIFYNLLNFYTFFISERPSYLQWILPSTSGCRLDIPDYNKVKELYSVLENEYNKNSNIKVAIYGLNNYIGYYQLRCLNPKSRFAKENIISETILDSDFRGLEINADYVIVINPLGLYAAEQYSRILIATQKMFLNNEGIAKNYKLIKSFEFSDGNKTNAFLFKRERMLTPKEIKDYMEQFYIYYPELKNLTENEIMKS